ncbi:MAG: tRNA(Ile)-lysidine synthase [Acidobacteriota bacterium]|jgi:tRNA(Ile)-lysidine synthase|nr:tRNA(Ile)-lysidine synthase [Acidobacteriota bacterium]
MSTIRKERIQSASQTRRGVGERARKRLSAFAGALLKEWKRLGLPVMDERVVVAVSGGADSVALVLALDELMKDGRLGVEVTVAHLDHGLRGEAGREDARWVEALADSLKFEVAVGHVDVKERAVRMGDNLEQAARRARYEFLAAAAGCGARVVVTGHTMDDQAETVLLRLLRGSGAEGLSGMEAVRVLDATSEILLARPLLGWARRAETEKYCRERDVEFRVDLMNEDESFARVRVRRQLLPLMETFNPRVVESLSRAAELLREDATVLKLAAVELLQRASEEEQAVRTEREASVAGSLSVDVLKGAPVAVRRRALRLWIAEGRGDLRRLELVHLVGVEKLLAGERGGRRAELPGGSFVELRRGRLLFYIK